MIKVDLLFVQSVVVSILLLVIVVNVTDPVHFVTGLQDDNDDNHRNSNIRHREIAEHKHQHRYLRETASTTTTTTASTTASTDNTEKDVTGFQQRGLQQGVIEGLVLIRSSLCPLVMDSSEQEQNCIVSTRTTTSTRTQRTIKNRRQVINDAGQSPLVQCGYDYVWMGGCSTTSSTTDEENTDEEDEEEEEDEELHCLPALNCSCDLFGDGNWVCQSQMTADCPNGEKVPTERGQACPSSRQEQELQETIIMLGGNNNNNVNNDILISNDKEEDLKKAETEAEARAEVDKEQNDYATILLSIDDKDDLKELEPEVVEQINMSVSSMLVIGNNTTTTTTTFTATDETISVPPPQSESDADDDNDDYYADFTNDFYITEDDDDDGNDLVFNFIKDDDDMNHHNNNNNKTDNDTIVSFGDDEDDESNDNNNTIVSLGGDDDDDNNDDDNNDHDDNDNDNDDNDNDNDSAGSTIIQIVPGDDPESDDDYTVEVTTRNGGDSDDETCQTVAELLCGEGVEDFTTVCGLFQEAFLEEDDTATPGLDNNDGGSRPTMTLFAPTDQAFAHLSELFSNSASYSKLLTDDGEYNMMMDIFYFHVTAGTVLQQELLCGELLEMSSKSGSSRTHCDTASGSIQNTKNTVKIQKGGGNRKNHIEPVILAADILACNNSVIHIISEVMLPNFIDAL